jgi:competence ComEA-like helix-hairpin-helix protein
MSDFLYFNQQERKGVLFFFSIIGLTVFLPLLYQAFWRKPAPIQVDIQVLDTIPAPLASPPTAQNITVDSLFPFDPNTAEKTTFLQLGLSERTANTLLNYRNKGGRFYRKEDLKKIYGMEAQWYEQVADYIQLSEPAARAYKKTTSAPRQYASYQPKPPVKIEVNAANADEWAKLRGIGPVLSERIVKFREKLGGFYRIEQVSQTYGLPDSTFQAIKAQLDLQTAPKKLFINQLDTEQLAQHPYISWKLARVIVNYRRAHGPFADPESLLNIYILEEATLEALKPYLDFCTRCPFPEISAIDKD